MRKHLYRHYLLSLASALLIGPAAASAATIGFNQVSGTWDYNDPSNWVGNNIDGIWDSSLTLTGTETVTFAANTVLTTGLSFGYMGNFDLTLDSSSATPHTVTLGGDIAVSPASNRTITLGNDTNVLNVDLGGVTRTFNVSTSKNLSFRNVLSDGDFIVAGGGTVKLGGAGGSTAGSATVAGGTLNFDSSTTSVTGATRAQSITLRGGTLSVNGNSGAASTDMVNGAITVDGASGNLGINFITVTPNVNRNAQLTATTLTRVNNGVVAITGTNLGAAPANGVGNVFFTTTPPTAQLVGGGGGAGTATVSILPWAVGGTTAGTISSFVTYDSNGVRPLNTATEYFDASATSFDGFNNADNVRIFNSGSTGISSTVDNSTTVNSLWLQATGGGGVTVSGAGTIHVTSGAVVLSANGTVAINTGLDFGAVQGVIGVSRGKVTQINGPISGSAGLVIYQLSSSAPIEGSGGTGVTLSTANTYTGDTYLFGRLDDNGTGMLPSGTRTGDLYNDGLFNISGTSGSTSVTINGLNGNGVVTRSSAANGLLTIGDNDANGNFTGSINLLGTASGNLSVTKIGAGKQILSGVNNYTGATTITAGTLQIGDAAHPGASIAGSGVTVNGGTLSGYGTISAPVTVNAGGHLAPGGSIGTLTVSNTLTLAGESDFEINNLPAGSPTNDQVAGITTLTYGGSLVVTNLGDANPANWSNGETFKLFSAGSVTSGSFFSSITLPTLPAGFTWETFTGPGQNNQPFDYVNGAIAVQGVPEPASLGLLAIGTLVLLNRRRERV
jgi:autotransporter-associated beta strand protein